MDKTPVRSERKTARKVAAMASSFDGKGYYLVSAKESVYNFCDARFCGSKVGAHLARRMVGIAAIVDGRGYYLVTSRGNLFGFGAATFNGSTAGTDLRAPIIGMAIAAFG